MQTEGGPRLEKDVFQLGLSGSSDGDIALLKVSLLVDRREAASESQGRSASSFLSGRSRRIQVRKHREHLQIPRLGRRRHGLPED